MSPLIKKSGHISNIRLAKAANTLVFLRQNSSTLPEISLFDVELGEENISTNFSGQLQDYKLAQQEVISWTSFDKTKIDGLIISPVNGASVEKVPLIVFVHGGPHYRIPNVFSNIHQVYATRGYATLMVNFRGTPGYGAEFEVGNIKDIGFGDLEDIMAGVDKVIQIGVADPEYLGIMGGSYGGFMTNMIISRTDRFKAAVSMNGIFSLITDFSNSYVPQWELNYLDEFYWDNLDIYLKHSPSTYVKNINTPVLIFHGQNDPNTVLSNSREMYTALQFLGKTAEFVTYPREVHGMRGEPNHIVDKHNRILNWFDKYMLAKPAAVQMEHPLVRGDWTLQITDVTSQVSEKRQEGRSKELIVSLQVNQNKKKEAPFKFNLSEEVSLRLGDDQEVSPSGLLGVSGNQNGVVHADALTFSRSESYSFRIVFQVSSEETSGHFKLKDFPWVELQF